MKNHITASKIFFICFIISILNWLICTASIAFYSLLGFTFFEIIQIATTFISIIALVLVFFLTRYLKQSVDKSLVHIWKVWLILYVLGIVIVRIYGINLEMEESLIYFMTFAKQTILAISLAYANSVSAMVTGFKQFHIIATIVFIVGIFIALVIKTISFIPNIDTLLISVNLLCVGIILRVHQNDLQ